VVDAAPPGESAHLPGDLPVGDEERGGAVEPGEILLHRGQVDGQDGVGTDHASALQHRQADTTEADHGDRLALEYAGRVDHRADAGQHRAAEQGGIRQRHVGRNRHHRPTGHHRLLGEAGDTEAGEDRLAAGQRRVGCASRVGTVLAEKGLAVGAEPAGSAGR
jgi:hypothetical protein